MDSTALDSDVKYPFQICGIFKTPVRTTSDDIVYSSEGY
jgi:hypothetical protein